MEVNKEDIKYLLDKKMKEYEKQYGKDFKLAVIDVITLEKQLNPTNKENQPERIIPLAKWNKYHDYPTVSALRQYAFRRKTNGFDEVIEYGGENGNRILLNERKFFEWHRNKNKIKKMQT